MITVVRRWRVDTMDEPAECLVFCSDPQAGEAAISRIAADLEEAGSALGAFEKGALGGVGAARAGASGRRLALALGAVLAAGRRNGAVAETTNLLSLARSTSAGEPPSLGEVANLLLADKVTAAQRPERGSRVASGPNLTRLGKSLAVGWATGRLSGFPGVSLRVGADAVVQGTDEGGRPLDCGADAEELEMLVDPPGGPAYSRGLEGGLEGAALARSTTPFRLQMAATPELWPLIDPATGYPVIEAEFSHAVVAAPTASEALVSAKLLAVGGRRITALLDDRYRAVTTDLWGRVEGLDDKQSIQERV